MTDHLARYDALGRKEPKKLGYLEIVRGLPWLAAAYTGNVPATRFVIEDGRAIVRCRCEEITHVSWNRAEPCAGECGRWFWYIGAGVRVAREKAA